MSGVIAFLLLLRFSLCCWFSIILFCLIWYCCCCCWVASVVSDSVWRHRRQPTRLPRPWDSPGKSTRVGCHFLLQCMEVKSESEVTQSCPTLSDPMDCSPPGSSIHGVFHARELEWGAIAFSVIGYCFELNELPEPIMYAFTKQEIFSHYSFKHFIFSILFLPTLLD